MNPLPTDTFVAAMERHWTDQLGNVSSDALRSTWKQLGDTFAEHIHGDHETKWTVLQPATGTGKSQATVVYAALLNQLVLTRHPGVLVVTRLKADADSMADQINALSGRPAAVAYHSDTAKDIPFKTLSNWPVVVITHAAYLLAMDTWATNADPWERLVAWNNHERKLVIIDEALDFVSETQVTLDQLRVTLAAIPQWAREKASGEVRIVERVIDLMERYDEEDTAREAVLFEEDIEHLIVGDTLYTFDGPQRALRSIKLELQSGGHEDLHERSRLCKRHQACLSALQRLLRSWVLYARYRSKHTLNTARLMIPSGSRGAVVLDATASSNLVYELFGVYPEPAPAAARCYSNVTVHLSRDHRVGRNFLIENAPVLAPKLMADLRENLESGSKVFLACHKDVEAHLVGYDTPFEVKTGHWGAIDGSNAWQDCDTGVFFGLPFLPDTRPVNVFFALQGPRPTGWLQGEERPFRSYSDVRKALRHSAVVVSLIQAINRTRCRRVIDERGNCEQTDIYVLLPKNLELAEALIEGIRSNMPGIYLADWQFNGAKRKATSQPKRSDHWVRVLKHFENAPPCRISASRLREHLAVPPATMKRITSAARDPESDFGSKLSRLGVSYRSNGAGRSRRAYFVKTA